MNHHFTFLDEIIKKAAQLHVEHIESYEPYPLDELDAITHEAVPDDPLDELVARHNLTREEHITLLLALAPSFRPQVLDIFFAKNPDFDRICTEFGGYSEKEHRGIVPTGETVMFLLTGRDVGKRNALMEMFRAKHVFYKKNLLYLEDLDDTKPMLSGRLLPHPDLVQKLVYGKVLPPKVSPHFPARKIETDLDWEDLIVAPQTQTQLQDIEYWLTYSNQLREHPELGKRAAKGYKALFYGPPGTGKTLTASLLGKSADRPVFLVDLSMIVSKYIGETEKNLANIFKKAEDKGWILFFDEADALFSKRTENESSNDRYANQEVAYLLQRVESYEGLVILASNLKDNIDKAFLRRFQSMVHFEAPKYPERLRIWESILPQDLPLDTAVSVDTLARQYDLTAAQISNVVQQCFIHTLSQSANTISHDTLVVSLRKEYEKENRMFEDKL